MLERLIEVLSQVAGIGAFAMAAAERVQGFIERRKSRRAAREEERGSEKDE